MALSRVTTWAVGQVLTAAALNNEFNNILANPITLISPTTGNINMASNQITNLVLEKLGADPSAGTTGRIFYNTASGQVKYDDGSNIVSIAQIGGTSTVVGSASGSYVRGLSGSLSTNLGVFSANQYLLQTTNATAAFLLQSTDAFTVNTRTVGPAANGRDQVAAFASTDVHWYAISTGSQSTAIAGLVSSNPPSAGPTNLPTSYVAWSYLGASKYSTGTSGVPIPHYLMGRSAYYESPVQVNVPSTTETPVDVTTYIPNGYRNSSLQIISQISAGGLLDVEIRLNAGGNVFFAASPSITSTHTVTFPASAFDCPIITTTAAFTTIRSTGGPAIVSVRGYTNPNGDM